MAFGQPQIDAEADGVLKAVNAYMSDLDSLLIQADVTEDSVYELLVKNAGKVIYVGVSEVNGTACHHIAGVLENLDWQL